MHLLIISIFSLIGAPDSWGSKGKLKVLSLFFFIFIFFLLTAQLQREKKSCNRFLLEDKTRDAKDDEGVWDSAGQQREHKPAHMSMWNNKSSPVFREEEEQARDTN